MTTVQFVCYIIFSIISLPIIWIRPHKLQTFFYITSAITIIFFPTLLIWSLATMGPGGFGSTLSSESALPTIGGPSSVTWLMVYGVTSTIGSIAAGILNQNDYARFAARPRHAIVGQAIAFPVYSVFTSVIGILVTAATQKRFGGEALWNLPDLFVHMLKQDDTSRTRVACAFAGLAMIASQLAVNVTGNALSGGFDLAATVPQFINIRRGAYITAVVSVAVNPWRLVNTATIFLAVLSAYSTFLGPMTGIMIASYLVVNKRKLNVDDMYRGDRHSIYWYNDGVNWRAFVAVSNPIVIHLSHLRNLQQQLTALAQWIIGVAPCVPGFINALNPSIATSNGAVELYYMNYLYGIVASGGCYALLHRLFPVTKVIEFIDHAPPSKELVRLNRERWDGDFPIVDMLGDMEKRSSAVQATETRDENI